MSKPKLNKAQLKQVQRGSRRKPRKSKKARPLASETRKVLAAGKSPSGETETHRPTEVHRPTLEQRKSLASKVAYIIERLKPTPEERAEFRELARTVARKLCSNRQGRRA